MEKSFDTKIVVDLHEMASPTHKVDCFKNKVALEIEWNNKDPFYDRDLNNVDPPFPFGDMTSARNLGGAYARHCH